MLHPKLVRWACATAILLAAPLSATADTASYGTAGAWTLYRTVEGGRVEACHATMSTGPGMSLIFDYNVNQTSIGFMTPNSADGWETTQIEVWFDNKRAESQVLEMPVEGEWRVYRSPNSEPDGILDLFANASSISFTYMVPNSGEQTATFSLKNTNAMTKKTYSCVQDAQ